MTNSSSFNQFSYVIEANLDVKNELINWVIKSQEYINQYFEGDRSRIIKTTFGDCVAKVEALVDLAIDDSYAPLSALHRVICVDFQILTNNG